MSGMLFYTLIIFIIFIFFIISITIFLYFIRKKYKSDLNLLFDCMMMIVTSFDDRKLILQERYEQYKKLHMTYNYITDNIRFNIEKRQWLNSPEGNLIYKIHLLLRAKMVDYLSISLKEDFCHFKIQCQLEKITNLRLFKQNYETSENDASIINIVTGIDYFKKDIERIVAILKIIDHNKFRILVRKMIELCEVLQNEFLGENNYGLMLDEKDFMEFNLGLVYILFHHFRKHILEYHFLMDIYYKKID